MYQAGLAGEENLVLKKLPRAILQKEIFKSVSYVPAPGLIIRQMYAPLQNYCHDTVKLRYRHMGAVERGRGFMKTERKRLEHPHIREMDFIDPDAPFIHIHRVYRA